MNGIDAHVIAVENPKAGADDPSVPVADIHTDGFLGNGPVHGGNDLTVHNVGCALQRKKRFDPCGGNKHPLFQPEPVGKFTNPWSSFL